MANRVIRDWTASEAVDKLSELAEVFFTRLIMKADDYGNYTGNPKLIKAALFPLKEYQSDQILYWINECFVAGLLKKYSVDGKDYLHIPNFGQTLRRMKAVYPPPTDGQVRTSDGALRTSDGQVTAETKGNEEETETETEVETLLAQTKILSDEFKYEFKPQAEQTLLDSEQWTEDVIAGNDTIFIELIRKRSLPLNGKLEKLARDHLDLSAKYGWHKKQTTQQAFRYSLLKHVKENINDQSNGQTKRYNSTNGPEPGKDYHAERL